MENCIISIFFHYSCDAAPDSKSWPILDVVVAGSNNPVRFCIISHIKNENDDDKKEKFSRIEEGVVGSAGSQEIAANFQQKLLFDLKFWNGTALHFLYQPYRKKFVKTTVKSRHVSLTRDLFFHISVLSPFSCLIITEQF